MRTIRYAFVGAAAVACLVALTAAGAAGPAGLTPAGALGPTSNRAGGVGARTPAVLAYVADSATNSVTPLNVTSNRAGKAIGVGGDPDALVSTASGKTVYVADFSTNAVTPIDVATNRAGPAIHAGRGPDALAITPNGRTLLVVDAKFQHRDARGAGDATSRSRHPGGQRSDRDRGHARRADRLLLDWASGEVTPVDLVTLRAEPPIAVGSYPNTMALSPNGKKLYVANFGSDSVTPIRTNVNRAGVAIRVGQAPNAVGSVRTGALPTSRTATLTQ